jgi:hypothetical protein
MSFKPIKADSRDRSVGVLGSFVYDERFWAHLAVSLNKTRHPKGITSDAQGQQVEKMKRGNSFDARGQSVSV